MTGAVARWRATAGRVDEDLLADFCQHIGTTPDELVAFCFLCRRDTGERFLSVRRRAVVNTWLDEFVAARGWTGKEAVVRANVVRGFLIHNGVPIQGAVWLRG
ncbi:hypothetical protein ACFWQL_23630 [Amycolatopsis thermoflava]|uniref:hypothetical protein n=1 Tax=Amycolatopsis thermoflava TaxID=84480 RepID=UPI003649FDDD